MSNKSEQRLQRRLKQQQKARQDAFSQRPILQRANDDDDCMAFSLKNLVNGYDLRSNKCTDYIRSQLILKLQTLCCNTWNTLFTKSKQSGGMEIIKKESFKVPLPACITEDVNHLYVLRFNSQNARLIGYRSNNIFQAIFVDVDLSTYDH